MRKKTALLLVLIILSFAFVYVSKPVLGTATKENTWVEKAPMHQARSDLGVAVVNGKIYAIGGIVLKYQDKTQIQSKEVGKNEEYDPATDSWTTIPTPIEPFGPSGVYNDKIYVLGGTKIYDPNTDTWSFGAALPKSFSTSGSVERSGVTIGFMAPPRMYVFYGGQQGNQVYDPLTDSWMVGADVPTSRGGFSVAVVDDLIYVIGGIIVTHPETIPMDAPFGSGGVATYYATVEQYTPFGYGTVPPQVSVVFPETLNTTASQVSLNFTINRPVDWMGYSLDGKDNITINGNTTITGLSAGLHNITVYAQDTSGNIGKSETVAFKIAESFPIVAVAAVSVAVLAVVAVAGLLVCSKKHRRAIKAQR